jgi:hypothetical protein
MSTQTGTSGRGLVTLGLAVIVVAGVMFASRTNRRADEERPVVLTVTFEPTQRLTPVTIYATLNGAPVVNNIQVKNSPWTMTVPTRRGNEITLIATQEVAARLDCAIDGVVQEVREFPGSVVCAYKR